MSNEKEQGLDQHGFTSRLAGFYREPLAGRLRRLFRSWRLAETTVRHFEKRVADSRSPPPIG